MKMRFGVALAPLCLCLATGSAWADLEPFSLGASETISHDSNIYRANDGNHPSDWYSTTKLTAAVNEPLGRQQLVGTAAADYTAYRARQDRGLDSFGYQGALRLDWNTIGDLSGSIGGDASRSRHLYGFDDVSGTDRSLNLETDSHAFARISLGGPSRWKLFGGFDATRRRFSLDTYAVNDEQQWSQSFGTTYSTTPDLSFGITGAYTRGEYPNYPVSSKFSSRSVSATTRLTATGNSAFNASVGYTTEDSDLQAPLRFVNGSVSWNWTPPSRFTVGLALARSTDGGATSPTGGLNDRSLNTTGSLNVSYEATAKISITAGGQYIQRKYADVLVPDVLADGTVDPNNFSRVSGTSHTSRVSLGAHYKPTRTADLTCSWAHEVRQSRSPELLQFSSNYVDNIAQCGASLNFN